MSLGSVDDVLGGLDDVVDRAIADQDARGYFAVLYRKVTATVKEGIASGFFDDAERMERLDVLFAQRYFDAIAAQDRGDAPTDSWAVAFAAGRRWRPLVLQHLLVGINAHINLDLGIAAARCSPGGELPGLRRDFDRINAVLAAMVASLQRDLTRISPWLGLLDRVGGRSADHVVRFSIVTARAGAWRFATELVATPEEAWEAAIADRDRAVARIGDRVLRPGARISTALLLIRLREQGDLAANLRWLREAPGPSFDEITAAVTRPSLQP